MYCIGSPRKKASPSGAFANTLRNFGVFILDFLILFVQIENTCPIRCCVLGHALYIVSVF